MTRTLLLISAGGLLLAGCGHPRNLQASFGNSFHESMAIQADRGRPTVADAAYPLTGFEGIELRLRVTEEATDEESGKVEAVDSFQVD